MPAIKIHPPKQPTEQVLSKQEFQDWQNELEIWLGEDSNMARFLTEGKYNTWQSQEQNPNRLAALNENVTYRPEASAKNRDDLLAECLAKQRRQLKTFLDQVAKCASRNMYAAIVRHATSLE